MGELEEIIDSIFFGQHDDVGTESESLVMNRPFRRPLKRDLSTIESITEEDEEEEEFDNDSQEIFEEEIYKLDDGSIRRKTISPHRSVTHRQGEELTDEESNFEEETDSGSVEMETAAAGDSRRTFGAGFAGISTVPTFEGRVATLDKKEDEQYEPDIFGRRNAKNRRNWFTNQYGANYMVMSGWELRRDLGPTPTASSDVIPYLKQLYVDENMDISELKQGPGNAPHAQRVGEPLKLPSCDLTEWRILSPPTFLEEMTTQGIQKTICAALNSRRRLRWLIGVNPMGVAVGCRLTLEQRDILSQAIDWCGAKEFVPVLVPRTIRIRFIPLLEEGEDLFEDNVTEGCLYVVELRVDEIADQLYQLSSGRVFFVRNERCAQAVSMDEVRQGLEKERAWKKDKEETAPFRFDPLHPNPLYGALTVAGFMALLVVYRKWY